MKISTRAVLVASVLALAVSANAGERKTSNARNAHPTFIKVPPPPAVQTSTWVGEVHLEIIGAVFSTLPEPYVSIGFQSIIATDNGNPANEASAGASQRVTLTTAEARALGEALIAFADNPINTETLLFKSY